MRIFATSHLPRSLLVSVIVLFAAVASTCLAGAYLFTAPAVIAPAAGVGLAGLLILGVVYWPIIFIATYITYVIIGAPLLFTIFFAIGHTVQAVAGAYILKHLQFDTRVARLRDALTFTAVAFGVSVIVPTFGFIGLSLVDIDVHGMTTDTLSWGHWWAGTILSVTVVTPFLIRWFRTPHTRASAERIETIAILAAAVCVGVIIFWGGIEDVLGISLIYVLFIPLGWIALRIGPRSMTLVLLLLSGIALSGSFLLHTSSSGSSLGMQLFETELFLIILATTFLILVSLEEERKEINKQLAVKIQELEDALTRLNEHDQAKNRFLAVLAHELRNPLATVVSHFELLKLQHSFTGESRESADVIERRFQNIQRLLDDLLDVSRISENKIRLQKQLVDIREMITAAVQNVAHITRDHKQGLVAHVPNTPLMIQGDTTRLEQIFTNLLQNASKFTPAGGTITVSVSRTDESVVVSVKDTGVGIGASELQKIFEVFYQESGNASVTQTGLGIGLALTRDLVIMHGGTIHAASAGKDRGSEFTVTFPRAHIFTAHTSAVATPTSTTSLAKPHMHILIVDDNKSVSDGMAKLLTLSGYTVKTAYTGADAITHATTDPRPEAIFLDIALPDMSGYEVARTLRTEHQYTGSIIAVSGYGQDENKQDAHDAGFTHHLTKPVRLAELLSVLK